jgi:predicted unusual protein kinase regulating ubiquinone biosynthesis (AarF/ABC1/UbiB family)
MPPDRFSSKGLRVPSGRLSRFVRFGSMASGVAGGMLLDGALQLASGKRPSLNELLMTPANALKVTLQLSQMRGAAMKLGQLLSLDAGELLPRELADIFARLRADAQHMPERQLTAQLAQHWGKDWRDRFATFAVRPLAAASIGQVHRATTKDGRDLAVKIQYPGVRRSIDSDVDNVATLLRVSNLLPRTIDIVPLLSEAKRQLHEEADYAREGRYLERFGALLADEPAYVVPMFHQDLSGLAVLAMSYADGVPIESLVTAPQADRDRVAALMIDLVLQELFSFGLMQTDPNFANYLYDPQTKRIVLLDFGATRVVPPAVQDQYRDLLTKALAGDNVGVFEAARAIGFFSEHTAKAYRGLINRMIESALAMLTSKGPVDFGNAAVIGELRDHGLTIAADRANWHIPPVDTLFVQRKLAGVYLLVSRLKARLDVREMLGRHLAQTISL